MIGASRVGVLVSLVVAGPLAWNNGPAGNTTTNLPSECASPRY